MKITSLLRVRNESLLLPDTLKHLSEISDEIFVFDDASKDNSIEICMSYPKVKTVIRNYFHNKDQSYVQTAQRHLLLEYAKRHSKNKWFLSSDGDDRFIFDWDKLDGYDKDGYSAVSLRCFDTYMTKDDYDPYEKNNKLEDLREYWGPEYRDIALIFRGDKSKYDLTMMGQRQPNIEGKIIDGGYLKHYGKCLSIEKWEEKCRYYIKSMPIFAEKWEDRKGKGVHEKSDFDRPLLTWKQINSGEHELVKI